jgi:hypothetical protein
MARNARQHKTTKIEFGFNGTDQEAALAFAKARGGIAKQAKLLGTTVWCAQVNGITTVFLYAETGRKVGLCMYRWCPRKIEECSYHTGGQQERTAY